MNDSFHGKRVKTAMQRDEEQKYLRNFWIKSFINSKFRIQSCLSLYVHINLNICVSGNLSFDLTERYEIKSSLLNQTLVKTKCGLYGLHFLGKKKSYKYIP